MEDSGWKIRRRCEGLLIVQPLRPAKGLCCLQLDVWGLGVILFGMVFGYAPFGEYPQDAEAFDQR